MPNKMKFKITPSMNDGKNDAPPLTVEAVDIDKLLDQLYEEFTNDYGEPFGVGFTLLIERVA